MLPKDRDVATELWQDLHFTTTQWPAHFMILHGKRAAWKHLSSSFLQYSCNIQFVLLSKNSFGMCQFKVWTSEAEVVKFSCSLAVWRETTKHQRSQCVKEGGKSKTVDILEQGVIIKSRKYGRTVAAPTVDTSPKMMMSGRLPRGLQQRVANTGKVFPKYFVVCGNRCAFVTLILKSVFGVKTPEGSGGGSITLRAGTRMFITFQIPVKFGTKASGRDLKMKINLTFQCKKTPNNHSSK